MSYSSQVGNKFGQTGTPDEITLSQEDDVEAVLDALNDADCRIILEALTDADELMSASELSEHCDVPLSTTYRKLEMLSAASLLDEQLRLCQSGKHTTVYGRRVADVRISMDADAGIELALTNDTSSGGALAD